MANHQIYQPVGLNWTAVRLEIKFNRIYILGEHEKSLSLKIFFRKKCLRGGLSANHESSYNLFSIFDIFEFFFPDLVRILI